MKNKIIIVLLLWVLFTRLQAQNEQIVVALSEPGKH